MKMNLRFSSADGTVEVDSSTGKVVPNTYRKEKEDIAYVIHSVYTSKRQKEEKKKK